MGMAVTPLDEDTIRVAFSGRLDVTGVDQTETSFSAHAVPAGKNVVVDMSDVSFIASLGIRMFIGVARPLLRKGAKMVLFGCQPAVRDVLETAALDELIAIVDDEPAATAALS